MSLLNDRDEVVDAFNARYRLESIAALRLVANSLSLFPVIHFKSIGIALLNKVSDLGDFRSAMVHAYWTIEPDGTTKAVRFPTRSGHVFSFRKAVSLKATEARATEQWLRGLRDHLLSIRERP